MARIKDKESSTKSDEKETDTSNVDSSGHVKSTDNIAELSQRPLKEIKAYFRAKRKGENSKSTQTVVDDGSASSDGNMGQSYYSADFEHGSESVAITSSVAEPKRKKKKKSNNDDIELMDIISEFKDVCPFCGKQDGDLRSHVKEYHFHEIVSAVSEQTDAFAESELESSDENNEEVPAGVAKSLQPPVPQPPQKRCICLTCGSSYDNEVLLEGHLYECNNRAVKVEKVKDTYYVCNLCNANIDMKKLKQHILEFHCELPPLKPAPGVKSEQEMRSDNVVVPGNTLVIVPPEAIYECSICNMKVDKGALKAHTKSHNLKKLPLKVITVTSPPPLVPTSSNPREKILTPNVIAQTEIPPLIWNPLPPDARPVIRYTCSQCPMEFDLKSDLEKHESNVHSPNSTSKELQIRSKELGSEELKRFQCDECGKLFKKKSFYKSHLALHKGDLAKECNKCFRSFASSLGLGVHMAACSSEKWARIPAPRECHVCQKTFEKFEKGCEHLPKMTKKPRAIPCPVADCHAMFAYPSELQKHKDYVHLSIRRFQCHICSKMLSTKQSLKNHLGCHDNATYKCPLCPQLLRSKNAVVSHMRRHTGEKPYNCSICGRKFRQKGDRDKHELKLHKAD